MSAPTTARSSWLPVVYARTKNGDNWWRVRPACAGFDGRFSDLVGAVYAGGEALARPRFLLARSHDHWLTGVACSSADLDESMSFDFKGRALYTFVGWLAAAAEDPSLPTLADWRGHYVQWAGPTYTEWCRPEWSNHRTDTPGSQTSDSAAVQWAATPPTDSRALPENPAAVMLFPESDAADIWARGVATASPFALVTGWENTDLVDSALVTHATVRTIAGPLTIARRERPSRSSRAPEPLPVPAVDPGELPAAPSDHHPDAPNAAELDQFTAGQGPSRRGFLDRLTGATADAEIRMLRDEVSRLRAQIDRLSDLPAHIDRLRQTVDDLLAHKPGALPAEPTGEDTRGHEE